MADPTPIFVYDSRDPATHGLEGTPAWNRLLGWMRTQHMNPNQTRRLEVYHLHGQWFARTLEYTQARGGGRLLNPAAEDWVTHSSAYVLTTPPPAIPERSAR